MRTRVVMVALMVATSAAPALAAGSSERVEALFLEGAAMYRAGRYADAVNKFKEAYAIYPEANLLFNIARSYEAKGALADAASYYSRFLRRSGISPRLKAKAKRKLKVISNATKQTESVKPTASPGPSMSVMPTDPGPPDRAEPASATSRTGRISIGSPEALASPMVSAREPSGSPSLGVWKWSAGALAVATIAAGSVVLWLGERDHQDVRDAKDAPNPTLTQREANDRIDAGSAKKIAGGLTLGTGALIGVVSAVLFVLDDGGGEATTQVGVVPTAGGGAVAFGGRF